MSSPEALRFTTSFFGETPELRKKAFIHPGIIVDLFPQNFETTKSNLCQCSKCNSFIHPHCDIDFQNHTWKCTFCDQINSLPVDTMNIQQNNEIIKAPIEPPKSLYIIDGSGPSRFSGLFEKTLKSLEIKLKDAKNVCICVLTTMLNILGKDGRIHTFPDLDDCIIPPSCFLSSPLPSFESLYNVSTDKKGPYVFSALEVAARSVGNSGRVFLATSYKTVEKQQQYLQFDENSTIRGADFDMFKDLIKKFQKESIIVSILYLQTSTILVHIASYSRLAAETGGKLEYLTKIALLGIDDVIDRLIGTRYHCSIKISNSQNGCQILPSLGLSTHNPNGFSCIDKMCFTFPFVLPEKMMTFTTLFCQLVVDKYDLEGNHSTVVITKPIGSTTDLHKVFTFCDSNCLVKYISNSLISLFIIGHDLDEFLELALALLKPMFESYRIHVSRSPNRLSSLVMPKSLQFVPLYTLGLLKSTVFSQCILYDERAGQMSRLNTMSPEEVVLFAYPTLSDVTAFVWHGGEITPLKLTDTELREKKLLLLDNGMCTWLWIGENLDKGLCQVAFAKPSQVLVDEVVQNESDQSRRLFSLVKGNFRHILQGTSSALVFRSRMVEDSQKDYPSSIGFIAELHKITLPKKK